MVRCIKRKFSFYLVLFTLFCYKIGNLNFRKKLSKEKLLLNFKVLQQKFLDIYEIAVARLFNNS